MKYLDPKNDLVFKKVFGNHANILKSFLNALLPLEPEQRIISLEYLPAEIVPVIPKFKNSIVDVRCFDNFGRNFIVEMQLLWSDSFKRRVLYNAAKTYVYQLDKGIEYKGLQPVYALSIVNELFEQETSEYYHHYKLVNVGNHNISIEGIQLIFIELPKFSSKNINEKKLIILWLRFLSELDKNKSMIAESTLKELQTIPEIAEALELAKESGFTKEELLAYDKFWDMVRTENTLLLDYESKGFEKGEKIGIEKTQFQVIHALIEQGMTLEQISKIVNLSVDEIKNLIGKL